MISNDSVGRIETAVKEAQQTLAVADKLVMTVARLMVGRLRVLNQDWRGHDTLRRLKRELRDYNAHTQTWKEDAK